MENQPVFVQQMKKKDWSCVKEIYRQGIETGNATFDTEPPSWEEWDNGHLEGCRLVACYGEQVIGWAALSQSAHKEAYRGVAEVSIYVSANSSGKGVGSLLLKELIIASEEEGLWTLQALIFPENTASMSLHIRNGFEIVGTRKRVGKLNNKWRDVVLLERRSSIVGVD
ncbi:GNAT family N-acetyltransferase [Ornithinibacillus bavariensis]|uniref:Phosphinothricin N-acetyltransferase n=1 Tax=Ornithinibacillus bavariensis TaxID=545502 RepID=A0A919X790_9BACI|nr:GNAT family N-acetyltransferase [Ornithinibacillus bavariensis]GIO27257.1 phosphinothricin N-acetyltransferase [Ornithinibacillus bavariensis]